MRILRQIVNMDSPRMAEHFRSLPFIMSSFCHRDHFLAKEIVFDDRLNMIKQAKSFLKRFCVST